jgi:hypothetical protein
MYLIFFHVLGLVIKARCIGRYFIMHWQINRCASQLWTDRPEIYHICDAECRQRFKQLVDHQFSMFRMPREN